MVTIFQLESKCTVNRLMKYLGIFKGKWITMFEKQGRTYGRQPVRPFSVTRITGLV